MVAPADRNRLKECFHRNLIMQRLILALHIFLSVANADRTRLGQGLHFCHSSMIETLGASACKCSHNACAMDLL